MLLLAGGARFDLPCARHAGSGRCRAGGAKRQSALVKTPGAHGIPAYAAQIGGNDEMLALIDFSGANCVGSCSYVEFSRPGCDQDVFWNARNGAVVGFRQMCTRQVTTVSEYMQQQGYRIIPVNPESD